MKSDDRNPYQICELQAHVSQQVVFGLRWRPCSSSRLNARAKLQIVICATTLWICLQEGPSLRLCEYFGAEDFAGPHYRPDDPGGAGFFARSALIQSASAPLRLLTLRSSEVAERTSSFLM